MKIITTDKEALEAISECVQEINRQIATAKEIANKFNLTLNINLETNQEKDEDSWESSSEWNASGCSF